MESWWLGDTDQSHHETLLVWRRGGRTCVDATRALAGHLRGNTEQATERFEGHVPRMVRAWQVWEHGKPCSQTGSQAYWTELPGHTLQVLVSEDGGRRKSSMRQSWQ